MLRKFTILGSGTSTGVPIPACMCRVCQSNDSKNNRSRCSGFLNLTNNSGILIDSGPDLRNQALRFGLQRIEAVLFTHGHADHMLGLDDLRGFNFVDPYRPIPCYADENTCKQLSRVFPYIINPDPNYEGGSTTKVSISLIQAYQSFTVADINVLPLTLSHGKNQILGYRIGNMVYATDCNSIPEESWQFIEDIDILILDGLRHQPHKTHFSIPEAIAVSKQLRAKKTILTHLTDSVDYNETQATLPENICLAYDGLTIEIDC